MSTPARLPAILLGGNANAVSVARSLARGGVEVTVYRNGADHVRYSRSCARFVDVGSGPGVGTRWLRRLLEAPAEAVILPCDDDALEMLARERPALVGAGYRPFEADDAVVLTMLDKEATYRVARAAGIATPRTMPLDQDGAVERALETVGLPCALKPVYSHRFVRAFRGRKAFVVSTADEFRSAAEACRSRGLKMIATEIIPGDDDQLCSYYAYVDERGCTLVGLTKRKIRQYPKGFGLGSFEVTDVAPDVAAAGAAFFAAAGIRGLANVEFKRDARSGALVLIECNHRFTASNELVRVAGVDLARIAYARLTDGHLPPLGRYRPGVTLWNPLRDLRGLTSAVRQGDSSIRASLPGLLRPHVLPVFRWDDPLPSVAYHAQMVGRLVARNGPKVAVGRAPARS